MQLNTGTEFVDVDGMVVEKKALEVVEAIKRIDPDFEVLCADPARAKISEAPFVLVHKDRNGQYYRVLEAWSLDDRILERIRAADTQRRDVLSDILKSEENYRKNAQRRYVEVRELMIEQTAAVMKNPKSTYTLRDEVSGDLIKFHDDLPATRNNPNGTKHFT